MMKSIKNKIEIKHTKDAHFKDGLALTKFIFWIKNINQKKITEIDAKNKLEKFRRLNKIKKKINSFIILINLTFYLFKIHYENI